MISCELHDYVEIACMYRYSIRLIFKVVSGEDTEANRVMEGIACDTARNSAGKECIKILFAGGEELIVLDMISKMEVLVDNPHFKQVVFNS